MLAASLSPFDEKAATSEFMEVFGRLKQATGAGTDTELARILGIKQGAVSSAKRNLQIPPVWIAKVSKAFSVSADWLFYGTGPMLRGSAQTVPTKAQEHTTSPIFISEEDAPDHGLTMVPKVKARLTAGTGSLETSGEVEGYYAFRTKFLKRKGRPGKMVLMDVVGDSMEPVVEDGDTVLIDESQREIIAGGMFAVGIEQEVFLKYLLRVPGKLVLQSRNERYAPIEVDMNGDLAGTVRIIGRVVWSCREYVR
ncbi:MAG TPA: S24 family peptidase [Solidesulfovibrio magneticus]|nr:S24 family peptidase [Solidesulfovibrio magneticus]